MSDFKPVSETISQAIKEWRSESFLAVQNDIAENLRGGALNIQSGNLMRQTLAQGRYLPNGFQVGTPVRYGRAWELGLVGGVFVKPVKAKALHWQSGGKDIFSRGHFLPKQAARPFLQPAIQKNIGPMQDLLTKRLTEDLKACFPSVKISVSITK
jgi:hypothetical protein